MRSVAGGPAVVWHDVECGAYDADLSLWRELARERGAPVLELGAGTGRVALDLARHGHEVWALEREPDLLDALVSRAGDLPVREVRADARRLDLQAPFPLVLAPMQFLQVLGGAGSRAEVLRRVAACLSPRGLLAAAIVDGIPEGFADADAAPPPLPDVRELDGWVYSSLVIDSRVSPEGLEVRRLRQQVSPGGELTEALHLDRLDRLDAAGLEAEAGAAGLTPSGREEIPSSELHVATTVVLLEGR